MWRTSVDMSSVLVFLWVARGANRSRVYLFITSRRAAPVDEGGGVGRHTYGSTHYFCDFRPRTTNHLTV